MELQQFQQRFISFSSFISFISVSADQGSFFPSFHPCSFSGVSVVSADLDSFFSGFHPPLQFQRSFSSFSSASLVAAAFEQDLAGFLQIFTPLPLVVSVEFQ